MIRGNDLQNTMARAPLCKTNTGHNVSAEHSKIDNIYKNNNKVNIYEPTRLKPPPREYDPDAIFGGDSDEDPYDYSDDEDLHCNNNSSSTGHDPGPFLVMQPGPRPVPGPLPPSRPTAPTSPAWKSRSTTAIGIAHLIDLFYHQSLPALHSVAAVCSAWSAMPLATSASA